jgi:hypothetical protein
VRIGRVVGTTSCTFQAACACHLKPAGAGLNAAGGGNIFTYQNNQAAGNVIDGAPTGLLTVK